jgi:hypothetical protein
MPLALACTLCLASTVQLAAPTAMASSAGALTLALSPAPDSPDLRLADAGAALALAQGEQGAPMGGDQDGSRDHGGAWMGTTMIVVMVVMMVGLGAVMMAHASYRMAGPSSAAASAVPVLSPSSFSTPGG